MAKLTSQSFFTGVGRRKEAVAQIRLSSGKDDFTLNGQVVDRPAKITALLDLIGQKQGLSISAVVRGGGMTGQLDAIALGVARALVELNPDLRSSLRKAGYLTRDPRIKERKKPGLKRARRAPQWAKR